MDTGRPSRWRAMLRMTVREMAFRVVMAVVLVAVGYGLFALSGKQTYPERITTVIEEAFTAADAGDRETFTGLFCDREAADRAYQLITGPPRLRLVQIVDIELDRTPGIRKGYYRGPRTGVAIVAVGPDRVAVPAGVSVPEQRQLYLRIPVYKRAKAKITWRLCDTVVFTEPGD